MGKAQLSRLAHEIIFLFKQIQGENNMLKMKESSKRFLKENLPEALEFEELNNALDALFDLIEEKGYEPPHYHDYNDFGREAQRVYDDLYLSND